MTICVTQYLLLLKKFTEVSRVVFKTTTGFKFLSKLDFWTAYLRISWVVGFFKYRFLSPIPHLNIQINLELGSESVL